MFGPPLPACVIKPHVSVVGNDFKSCYVCFLLQGEHGCRHGRHAHSTARQSSLLTCLPAAERSHFRHHEHPDPGRHPPSAPAPALIRDPRWCAPASRLGDGQDSIWPEIFPQVSGLQLSFLPGCAGFVLRSWWACKYLLAGRAGRYGGMIRWLW